MALFSSLLSHPEMAARYRFIRKCLSPPLTRDETEIQFIIREYHPSRIRSRKRKWRRDTMFVRCYVGKSCWQMEFRES